MGNIKRFTSNEFVEKNKNLIRIIHSESQKLYLLGKERIEKTREVFPRLIINSIAKILKEGITANEIREIDPEMGAVIFQGMIASVVFHWMREGGKEASVIEQADLLLDFFLKGIAKSKS